MTTIYTNTIQSVGSEASSFLSEKMLVTFGDQAPAELRDYCFALAPATSDGVIEPGVVLRIDEMTFPITAVGGLAQRNLDSLGHITLVFDGAAKPKLEGAIHVLADDGMPEPKVGSTLSIETA